VYLSVRGRLHELPAFPFSPFTFRDSFLDRGGSDAVRAGIGTGFLLLPPSCSRLWFPAKRVCFFCISFRAACCSRLCATAVFLSSGDFSSIEAGDSCSDFAGTDLFLFFPLVLAKLTRCNRGGCCAMRRAFDLSLGPVWPACEPAPAWISWPLSHRVPLARSFSAPLDCVRDVSPFRRPSQELRSNFLREWQ